jgi:hypothetical protein
MRTEACWECGKSEEVHYHHVVPRSKGGTKTLPLCLECHGKVHGKKMNSSSLVKAAYKRLVAEHGKGNFKWGPGKGSFPDDVRKKGTMARGINADQDALRVWSHIQVLEKSATVNIESTNWSCLSRRLNAMGVRTRRGGDFNSPNLKRIITRAIERGAIKNIKKSDKVLDI